MIYNHLFWMAVALFFCSTINIYVYSEYKDSVRILPKIICVAGIFGMLGGLLRLIMLSLAFNWWWLLGISSVSLLLIGAMAHASRVKGRLIIATVNVAIIPIVWWYGSKFSYDVSFTWFYDSLDAVKQFFA